MFYLTNATISSNERIEAGFQGIFCHRPCPHLHGPYFTVLCEILWYCVILAASFTMNNPGCSTPALNASLNGPRSCAIFHGQVSEILNICSFSRLLSWKKHLLLDKCILKQIFVTIVYFVNHVTSFKFSLLYIVNAFSALSAQQMTSYYTELF